MRISDWCSDVCSSDLFFFSRAFELLRQEKPEIISILSYADPMRRIGPAGDVIMPGHVGRAYQCFGAAYRGRTKPRSEMATPDGQIFSERSEEHTSELQSLMRISYAVFCLKKKKNKYNHQYTNYQR